MSTTLSVWRLATPYCRAVNLEGMLGQRRKSIATQKAPRRPFPNRVLIAAKLESGCAHLSANWETLSMPFDDSPVTLTVDRVAVLEAIYQAEWSTGAFGSLRHPRSTVAPGRNRRTGGSPHPPSRVRAPTWRGSNVPAFRRASRAFRTCVNGGFL